MNNVLVLGGTGFVGRAVCERLAERGRGSGRILVPTRRLGHGCELRALPTLELVQANVHDEAQLARCLEGVDAVINLVAILHGKAAEFDQVHAALVHKLARACAARGVRRVVHVSALGAAPEAPSRYQRSKAAGEAALRASDLEWTLLRPSVIFGAEDRFLNFFAQMQAVAPIVPLGCSAARFQPVWVQDVASAIVACLDRRDSIGQVYECTGPKVYTLSELMRLAGRWSGHERPQIPLPGWAARLQALAMEYLPGTPLLSRDNLDSMQQDNVASGDLPGLAALGVTASALEAVAPAYLGQQAGCARLEAWRAGAGRA